MRRMLSEPAAERAIVVAIKLTSFRISRYRLSVTRLPYGKGSSQREARHIPRTLESEDCRGAQRPARQSRQVQRRLRLASPRDGGRNVPRLEGRIRHALP